MGYNKWLMVEKLSSTALMEVLARISAIKDRGARDFWVKMSFRKYFPSGANCWKEVLIRNSTKNCRYVASRLFASTPFDRSVEASRVKMLHRLCTQAVGVHANVKLVNSLVCHAIFFRSLPVARVGKNSKIINFVLKHFCNK